MVDLANLLDYYDRYVRFLGHDREALETEALVLLTTRDALDDYWHRLTEEQRRLVGTIDLELNKKHKYAASVLPGTQPHPRSRWWWFLHEGPQLTKRRKLHPTAT